MAKKVSNFEAQTGMAAFEPNAQAEGNPLA
jgi:hypothetical protein